MEGHEDESLELHMMHKPTPHSSGLPANSQNGSDELDSLASPKLKPNKSWDFILNAERERGYQLSSHWSLPLLQIWTRCSLTSLQYCWSHMPQLLWYCWSMYTFICGQYSSKQTLPLTTLAIVPYVSRYVYLNAPSWEIFLKPCHVYHQIISVSIWFKHKDMRLWQWIFTHLSIRHIWLFYISSSIPATSIWTKHWQHWSA